MNFRASLKSRTLPRLLSLALFAAVLSAGQAQAALVTETGDAGQALGTAQNTATGGGLQSVSAILGSLSSSTDADLYIINIGAAGSFWASTDNADTAVFDTQLFLLSMTGKAIALNDDANGFSSLSTLSIDSLAAGTYILGVSQAGYDPVNVANQFLFAAGSLTSTRGPAGGLQPEVLAGFYDGAFFPDGGSYTINLRGVDNGGNELPEPASLLLTALAGGAALLSRRRKS